MRSQVLKQNPVSKPVLMPGSGLTVFYNHCRCLAGYYGDPIIGSGDHCRPCPCPDGPNSGRQFARSCYQDPITLQLACVCDPGYIGKYAHTVRSKEAGDVSEFIVSEKETANQLSSPLHPSLKLKGFRRPLPFTHVAYGAEPILGCAR